MNRNPISSETIISHLTTIEVFLKFIRPQDGHDKQDCEIASAKRWLKRCSPSYAAYKLTLLGDDLYAHQPFCHLVLKAKLNFIFVCKPDSHRLNLCFDNWNHLLNFMIEQLELDIPPAPT